MTTESQVDVFSPAEKINLVVQFAGQALQGLLASKPAMGNVAELSVIHALSLVDELEDHFRREYAAKAAELKAAQEAATARPLIVVPNGGGIIQ